jgi:ATP-binding cassette subfamily B (MDR/TAP) protein 1
MRKIQPIYSLLSKAKVASATLNKVINSTPIIDPLSSSGVVLNELHGEIRLENVTYSYPMRPSIRVIDHLNINFAAGKTTALIGASGSGKSTIVGLLERWYDPLDGTVLIDGCNANSLNVKFLRSNIRLVQQVSFSYVIIVPTESF